MSETSGRVRRRAMATVVAAAVGMATAMAPGPAAAMVGGAEVAPADFPFVALGALFPPHRPCDGTLIAVNTILTTASCDIGYGYPYQYWRVGPWYLRIHTITKHLWRR